MSKTYYNVPLDSKDCALLHAAPALLAAAKAVVSTRKEGNLFKMANAVAELEKAIAKAEDEDVAP